MMELTKDELNFIMLKGSGFADGKKRIQEFFSQQHDERECASFLSNEYGIGGSSHALDTRPITHMWHDSKGITVSSFDSDDKFLITWSVAATLISNLVKEGRYLPSKAKPKRKKKKHGKVALYPIPLVCPYCGEKVKLSSNKVIYGKSIGNGKVYRCTNQWCDSYVGVHTGTNTPLGRLANKELRLLKNKAHRLFDGLWKSRQYYS